MNTAFYTGASGLRAHQNAIDITSHNLVNCNTYGYKATKPEFRELLYSKMDINKNRELEDDEQVLSGHGVMLSNQDLMFTQGALYESGYALDYAIAGEGLFAIERNGSIEYTRNGSFDLSIEGNDAYLVTCDGAYVLDENYNRIQVPYNAGTNVINTDGLDKKLGVFNFSNLYGLRRTNYESFQPTDISGEPQIADEGDYNIYEHSLERSNVDVAQEFADVIVSQKAYQFSARVVTTADEIEQVANSLRK
ncbi:flagellar hook-basal body protein [Porcipelethomonas sp.]|uniref:flagellar hook-basal body protein n=1 Tax=Porcipelethomonas sp. TaxID=2981675 RepID=UPI003EF18ACB